VIRNCGPADVRSEVVECDPEDSTYYHTTYSLNFIAAPVLPGDTPAPIAPGDTPAPAEPTTIAPTVAPTVAPTKDSSSYGARAAWIATALVGGAGIFLAL
jgi:hypothetical protein